MAGPWVWHTVALELNFLPDCCVRIATQRLNDPSAVQVIEKYLAFALSPVYVNLVIHDAATVRVTCLGNLAYLLTLDPAEILVRGLAIFRVYKGISSAIPQVELRNCHKLARITRAGTNAHFSLDLVYFATEANKYPQVVKRFFSLVQPSVNYQHFTDNLANVSFTSWWRLAEHFEPGPTLVFRAEFIEVPKRLVAASALTTEQDQAILKRNARM